MGFGGILKSIAGPVIGLATGNPALGALAGGIAGGIGGGKSGVPSTAGTSADPSTYLFQNIPGVKNPEGAQSYSMPGYVNSPQVPDLPNYNLPVYGTNNPILPVQALQAGTGEKGMLDAIRQAQAFQAAALNPNDPLAKQLSYSEDQGLRNDFLRNLRDVIAQNKRGRRSGRGLIDPERSDESILSAILSNASTSSTAARGLGSQRLRDMSTSSLTTASQYGNLATQERSRQDALRQDILNRVNQLRSDAQLRNQQLRENAATSTDTMRADILRRYGVDVGNIRGANDAAREDTRYGVNQWNENYGKLGAANAQVNELKSANQQNSNNLIGQGIGGILQAISGGGSSSKQPWQAAGNVNPAGGFY